VTVSVEICNACGYCIFVYGALGQVCWPWMTPCTIGSVAHMWYRASWKNVLGILESPEKILDFFLSKRVGKMLEVNDAHIWRWIPRCRFCFTVVHSKYARWM